MKRDLRAQKFSTTRDVFLKLARNSLGPLVNDFNLRRTAEVRLDPYRQNWAHQMIGSVLSKELERAGAVSEIGPAYFDRKRGTGMAGESYSAVGPWGESTIDSVVEFRVGEMNVNYKSAGTAKNISWTKRNFTMKLLVELIDAKTGNLLLKRTLTPQTSDKIPTSMVEKLKTSSRS